MDIDECIRIFGSKAALATAMCVQSRRVDGWKNRTVRMTETERERLSLTVTYYKMKEIITRLGIGRNELAERLGVNHNTLNGWYYGNKNPRPEAREKIHELWAKL